MNIIKDITTPIKTFLLGGLAVFIIVFFALTGSIQADKVDNSVTQSTTLVILNFNLRI